jgi:hypothetical protein
MASGDARDPALVPTLSVTPSGDTDATAPGPRDLAVTLVIGERIADRYLVRSFLGEGGMGAVYRAFDETLGEDIALKVVRGTGVGQTLRDEVRLAQKVTHANVCRTYDLEEAGGHHFVKMELVEGETLAARLARTGKLPVAEAVRIALAIADGLAAAHAKGIVHRDLKPGNVMLSGDRVVLMDFGIARLIARPADGLAGTIGYMAPEQITEGAIDGRADLYSLGCVLYEMLAGEPLFGDAKRFDLAVRHASTPAPDVRFSRPEVPGWLARAVHDLLAKVPDRRDAGVARLRAGPRSPLRIVVPIGLVVVALASLAIWRVTRHRTWQPELVHFEAYEETGSTTSISPDGAWLVFDSDRAQRDVMRLYVMSRATGDTVALATPPGIDVLAPRWTRDGTAILYQAVVPGGDHIYRQPVAGTPPAISGPPIDLGQGLAPAPCGDAIVYIDSGPIAKRVMLLASDGSRRTLATIEHNDAVTLPRCDPAGDRIVFVHGKASVDSGNDVYIVDRAGVAHQLTTDHAASNAMFTADGRSIVFAASHGTTRDLYEMPASGGVPRPLVMGDVGVIADVSHDGRFAVFHRDDSSTLPVISEPGNVARPITNHRGNYFWARPTITDRIVARRETGARSDIVTVGLADGAITVIARGYTGFPSFDGKRIYFRNPDAANVLMVVPIDGGSTTAVATLPGTIMQGVDGPDGQHLAVESGVGVVDAYRVVAGHAEAEGAPGLVTVAPSGGWRAVTLLFAKTGGNTSARLLLIPPGAALSAPRTELAVSSVYNLWLDDHRIGYCNDGSCHVLDVTAGTTEDVPVYPKFYEHGAVVTPDGKHIVDSFEVARITRHAITNFDAR